MTFLSQLQSNLKILKHFLIYKFYNSPAILEDKEEILTQIKTNQINQYLTEIDADQMNIPGIISLISLKFPDIPGYEIFNLFLLSPLKEKYYCKKGDTWTLVHDPSVQTADKLQLFLQNTKNLEDYKDDFLKHFNNESKGVFYNYHSTCYIITALQILCRISKLILILRRSCMCNAPLESFSFTKIFLDISKKLLTGKRPVEIYYLVLYLGVDVTYEDDPFAFMEIIIPILIRENSDFAEEISGIFLKTDESITMFTFLIDRNKYNRSFCDLIKNESQADLIIVNLSEPTFDIRNAISIELINLDNYMISGLVIFELNHYYLIHPISEKLVKVSDTEYQVLNCPLDIFSTKVVGLVYSKMDEPVLLIHNSHEEKIDYFIRSLGTETTDYEDISMVNHQEEFEVDTDITTVQRNDTLSEIYNISSESESESDDTSNSSEHLIDENNVETELNEINFRNRSIEKLVHNITNTQDSFYINDIKEDTIGLILNDIFSSNRKKNQILFATTNMGMKNYIHLLDRYDGILKYEIPDASALDVSILLFVPITKLSYYLKRESFDKLLLIVCLGFGPKKQEIELFPDILEAASRNKIQSLFINYDCSASSNISKFEIDHIPTFNQNNIQDNVVPKHKAEQILVEGYHFESRQDAIDLIKKHGFTIGVKYSIKDNAEKRIRMRCHLYNKAKCKHKLTIRYSEKEKTYRIASIGPDHSHPLDPDDFVHEIMKPGEINLLLSLRKAKVSVTSIIKLMKKWKNISILYPQIKILEYRYTKIKRDEMQSKQLLSYMEKINGFASSYKSNIAGVVATKAVFTITQTEMSNLEKSFVLKIDGTHFPNYLGWELILLVSKNEKNQILNCGALFTTSINKEIVTWLLSTIFELNESKKVTTILTDEDMSMYFSLKEFNENREKNGEKRIYHGLCQYHKLQNFKKCLLKYVKDEELRKKLKKLFKKLLDTPYEDKSNMILEQIDSFHIQEVSDYIKNNVLNNSNKLLRSKINYEALGNYTTSNSESANSLVKSGKSFGFETLKSMRKAVSFYFDKKVRTENYKSKFHNHKISTISENYHITGPIEQLKLLDFSLQKAQRLECITRINDDNIYYCDPRNDTDYYTLFDPINKICSCRRLQRDGIPCSHLIRFRMDNKLDLFEGIHPFYKIENSISVDAINSDATQTIENIEQDIHIPDNDIEELSSKKELLILFNQFIKACDSFPEEINSTIDFLKSKLNNINDNVVQNDASHRRTKELDLRRVVKKRGRPRRARYRSPLEGTKDKTSK